LPWVRSTVSLHLEKSEVKAGKERDGEAGKKEKGKDARGRGQRGTGIHLEVRIQ